MQTSRTDPRVDWWKNRQDAVNIIDEAPAPQALESEPADWSTGSVDVVTVAGIGDTQYLFTIDKRQSKIAAIHRADDPEALRRHRPPPPPPGHGADAPTWFAALLDELPAFARALDLAHYLSSQTPKAEAEDEAEDEAEAAPTARSIRHPVSRVEYIMRSGSGVRVVALDAHDLQLHEDQILSIDEAKRRFDHELVLTIEQDELKVNGPLPAPGPLPPKEDPPYFRRMLQRLPVR